MFLLSFKSIKFGKKVISEQLVSKLGNISTEGFFISIVALVSGVLKKNEHVELKYRN